MNMKLHQYQLDNVILRTTKIAINQQEKVIVLTWKKFYIIFHEWSGDSSQRPKGNT